MRGMEDVMTRSGDSKEETHIDYLIRISNFLCKQTIHITFFLRYESKFDEDGPLTETDHFDEDGPLTETDLRRRRTFDEDELLTTRMGV